MADGSPVWKRPSQVMLKRKKRIAIQEKAGLSSDERSPSIKDVSGAKPLPKSVKRRNPFGCSASKRVALSDSSNVDSDFPVSPVPESSLFAVLDHNGLSNSPTVEASHVKVEDGLPGSLDRTDPQDQKQALEDGLQAQQHPVNQNILLEEKQTEKPKYVDHCPIDWSLRTKMRLISDKPFNWCSQMSSVDECSGTVGFVKGNDVTDRGCNTSVDAESKAEFKQLTHYWMHPNLPWLKLFPRITQDSKTGKPSVVAQDDALLASLMSDWCESLTSAFQHLRCGFCPYFYLCCHHLTVLFRASGVAGHQDMHALISPTSRGFRNVLKEEGIDFTMPLNPQYKHSKEGEEAIVENADKQENLSRSEESQTSEERGDGDEVVNDDDDNDEADDAASSWLKDLGLDAAKYKSLDPKKIKLQKEGYKNIDQRLESVIVVEGSDVQALFNYLLNSSNLVSPTGWQACIPPTIIAPTSFKGATLKSHQVKSGSVRQTVGEQHAYSLEVLGPIMPFCLDGLLNLFSQTQNSYTASFSVHEPSTSLNGLPLQDVMSDADICCEKASVAATHLRHITKNFDLNKFALREVRCESGKYSCIL